MIEDEKIYSLDLEVLHLFNNEELNNIHYYTLIRKTWLECKWLIYDLGINWNNVFVGKRESKKYFWKWNMIDVITIKKVIDHCTKNAHN